MASRHSHHDPSPRPRHRQSNTEHRRLHTAHRTLRVLGWSASSSRGVDDPCPRDHPSQTSQAHLAQERRTAAVESIPRSASLQNATFPNFWLPLFSNPHHTCRMFRFARLCQMTMASLPDLQSDIPEQTEQPGLGPATATRKQAPSTPLATHQSVARSRHANHTMERHRHPSRVPMPPHTAVKYGISGTGTD
jgi:hypothetical protein